MSNKCETVMSYALLISMCTLRMAMAVSNLGLVIAIIAFGYWCWLNKAVLREKIQEKLGWKFLRLYGFLLLCFLPAALFPEPYSSRWYSLKQFPEMLIYRALPFFLLVLVVEKEELVKKLFMIFLGVEAVDSLLSVWQVYAPLKWQPVIPDNYPYRGMGFGGQPLNLAALLASLIPVTVLVILDDVFDKQLKTAAWWSLPCMLLGAVIGLKSRALWLLLGIIVPFAAYRYVKQSKKVLCVFLVCVIGLGGYFAFNRRARVRMLSSFNITTNVSNRDRIWLWKSSINMMKDHPLTGVGLGNYRYAYKKDYQLRQIRQKKLSHAHNNWMHLGADAGLLALLGYTIFTFAILWHFLCKWLYDNNVFDLMIFCTWAAFTAYGLVDLTADSSISLKLVSFLTGLIICLKNNISKRGFNKV